ncbi:MAG: NUDIX hydrolase [Elusimicrobia bacterium]|nr:NUDIX hydrolase [Elusimicrobiota bacterium]
MKKAFVTEVSAGGVVLKEGRLLTVQVQNLLGDVVWTLPKGHLEKGETAAQAALREVEEETGWACRVKRPFGRAHYFFMRNGRRVSKTVHWFLMEPLKKTGESDPEEILKTGWASLATAGKRLTYPSDREILKRLSKSGNR